MAHTGRTVTVDLDIDLVTRARNELGEPQKEDGEIVSDVLNAYLLGRLLDRTQSAADLTEEEAMHLAVEETHAARRERREDA
jgi:hypothetical protein